MLKKNINSMNELSMKNLNPVVEPEQPTNSQFFSSSGGQIGHGIRDPIG